jgi:hypothetical protein
MNNAGNAIGPDISANTGDAISHTVYFKDAAGGELRFHQVDGADRYFEVDEVSLKVVTHDLVSYWELDTVSNLAAGSGNVKDSHGSNHGTVV